ncbi:hypothetical protein FB451DRAFT_1499919 [Mycena latifolia]|nr:hypothetical protein FB451DRAFT_1499919 [Mycena latifolia]
MVAVNPRFTLLAFSLASLSLTPSAEAAAIHTRPSDTGSPSKPTRQHARILPMPLQAMKRSDEGTPKRGKFLKSRVAEVEKRQQAQARFDVKHRIARRDAEAPQVPTSTPGHVDITSPTPSSTTGPTNSTTNSTTIGHLLLNTTTTPYVLDASEKNMTTLYMVPFDSNHCTLQLPLFDPTQNTTSAYCATFDPKPPAPEPLTMTPCFNASNETTPHVSQTFLYDPRTGVVQPMWFNGEDDGNTDETSANTVNDEEVNGPNADASESGTLNSRDTSQNVTLVFVPNAVGKNEVDQQDVSPNSQSMSDVAAKTTDTVTTTVTASPTPSFVAADIDQSTTTDVPSQSTSFPSDRFLSSTTSSAASSATPSFAAADVNAASSSSATDVPPQSTMSTTDTSATPSFAAADVDASSTDVPPQSTVSAMSSDSSDPTPSFVAANIDSSSTGVPSQTSSGTVSATSSDASTVGALDVQVAAAPSSTDMATTDPTSSSYSSVPTATTSTVDAAAVAAAIASSSASSSSAAPSPSSSADGSTVASPPTSDNQAVYVGGSNAGPAARAEMTPALSVPLSEFFELKRFPSEDPCTML